MAIPRIYGAARRQAKAIEQERMRNAAPALLEALELIKEKLGAIYDMTLSDEDIAKIDAAIAAARGTV